eukprot:8623791-Pyramimonas_sp.AAC.1
MAERAPGRTQGGPRPSRGFQDTPIGPKQAHPKRRQATSNRPLAQKPKNGGGLAQMPPGPPKT